MRVGEWDHVYRVETHVAYDTENIIDDTHIHNKKMYFIKTKVKTFATPICIWDEPNPKLHVQLLLSLEMFSHNLVPSLLIYSVPRTKSIINNQPQQIEFKLLWSYGEKIKIDLLIWK